MTVSERSETLARIEDNGYGNKYDKHSERSGT